jgi:hypothetical protein
MTAVASLVEKNDVDAANALLVAGSRYITHSGDLDLHPDSDPFYTAFYKALPDPGIDAIANQLAIGNEKNWLICFYLIQKYAFSHYADKSALVKWASSAENRASAERLHNEIRKLLQAGSLDNSQYKDTARQTSLLLALTLERPLQQEPKLRETIEEAIAKSKIEKSATELLKTAASENRARPQAGGYGGGLGMEGGGEMMGMGPGGYGMGGGDMMGSSMGDMMGSSMPAKSTTKLTPAETLAAHRLGIALPPSLLTDSILTDEILFRDQLQTILLAELKASPELYADEITLKLWESLSPLMVIIPTGQQMTETSEKFWTEVLPLVQTRSSQPRLLFDSLEGVYPQQSAGMSDMGSGYGMGAGDMYGGGMPGMAGSMGAGSPIPKPLVDVIIQTKASAAKRVP